ncbi:hypothetical protein TGDOM2_306190 [Toxoplasma gondii GAB2-2007-GAL-DOM2]|uniref:Uncharacterized protein n=9 Tax=Toxoplasma gondii TaxID=5811 RepID=S7VQT7_TOXGG|nr:hypothetical protein TGGT1_306190 [Toxoplasma gondii GT1]KAF4644769.1 hypothetical protein TGRH88_017630 [Toxoplasma gondii]KFG30304.1 hypothetical protein TGP89_306190 [Toxoplasma gondii p89]KFG33481.1 hypothetical protein TGDOM2_306190 [Toxoplasma gondii GAB2-2007-GAL-DOM2]KFG45018.1 hypothetical protein TGFOU_306190 [Toxoplasma gondii FOU]KFH02691.1 hypothetical protein TGVAND_306190 [Toxoplasma gondii VAND]KFH09434.1 hypothetical protein TGMAS_306190 [Toxoplasma gondii MAS]PUA86067.1 
MASPDSTAMNACSQVEGHGTAPDPLENSELGVTVSEAEPSETTSPAPLPSATSSNGPTLVLPAIPGLPINMPELKIPEDLKKILANQETLQKLSSACIEKTQQLFNEPTVRQLRQELYMALPENVKKTHADVLEAYEKGGILKLVELGCQLALPVIQQLAQKILELCIWLAEHREEIAGALAGVYQTVRSIVLQLQYRLMTEVMKNVPALSALRNERSSQAMLPFLPAFAAADSASTRSSGSLSTSVFRPSSASTAPATPAKDLLAKPAQPAAMYSGRTVPQYQYSYVPVVPRQGTSAPALSRTGTYRLAPTAGVREAAKKTVVDATLKPAKRATSASSSVSAFFSSLFGQKEETPVVVAPSFDVTSFPVAYTAPVAGASVSGQRPQMQTIALSNTKAVSGYAVRSYGFNYAKKDAQCVTCGQPVPVSGLPSYGPVSQTQTAAAPKLKAEANAAALPADGAQAVETPAN